LKLREEARTVFLQKKSKELLDNNELQVWQLLIKNHIFFYNYTFFIIEFMVTFGQEPQSSILWSWWGND